MDRGRAKHWSRRWALLSITVLCVGSVGLGVPSLSPRHSTLHTLGALDTATVVPTSLRGPVLRADVRPVVRAGQIGPYASTVAGLVDIDSRIPDGTASGTGIVLRADGIVVTNNHVVARASTIVATALSDGRAYPAIVLSRDPAHDVAVIRLTGASGLPVAPIGDSDQVGIGDRVAAIGNAGGRGGRPTVTTGEVTALDQSIVAADESTHQRRHLHGMIEVSAAVQPGDSGGALVGAAGVIGMNTATGPVAGYAIPINTVIAIAHEGDTGAAATPDLSEKSSRRALAASSGRVTGLRVTRSHGG